MTNQVIGVTIKGVGDFSDVVSNVGSVQKALTKLKLPDKLGDNLNKHISSFYKEYEKYQKKIAEGIHTQGDQNAVNKSLNSMLNSYEKIINEFGKLSKKDFKDIFNLDDSAFASVQKRIKEIQAEIKKIKIDPKQLSAPMDEIEKMTKAKAVSGGGKGLDKIRMGIDANDIFLMKEGLQELTSYYDRFASKMGEQKRIAMAEEIEKLKTPIENAISASDRLEQEAKELDKQFENIGNGATRELDDTIDALDRTRQGAEKVTEALKKQHQEEFSFNREAQNIDRQIQSYFGLSQMIRKVGDIAKDAFATVKELDKAMTETAVVTNFSVGDMWEMLPTYTQQANQLGSTIRDVYEAATLYYQQGLNTNQAMSLANETLKMARIAGLDAADATNMMTAALRGFNMEINQTSAQKINDVYSELAAITASDTKEIGSAMERTASIANSANMQFETTSAFLAQMIETTREAPENLGTAMKTIVARFQEMKKDPTKLVDSEGVAMDANKVDTALKSIGVQLMNTKGEFRDLDEVFLDIAAKWDSLTQGQQRYIATIAAGSRQQSRFIAMMSNYERTMELVDAANNSAGASQRQFEKTLDSMEAKLNKLKNAWDQFTMGLMNNQILKFGVDRLTDAFTIVNKFIDVLGKLPPKPFEGITKSLLTLITTLGMLNFGKRGARGLVMGGAAWFKGEGSFTQNFANGWKKTEKQNIGEKQGFESGHQYGIGFNKGFSTTLNNNSLLKTISSSYGQLGKQAIGWNTIQTNKAFLEQQKILNNFQVGAIVDQLLPEEAITAEATAQLQKCIDEAEGNVRAGLVNYKHQTGKGKLIDNTQAEKLQKQYDNTIPPQTTKILGDSAIAADKFGLSITNAGMSLQNFGYILQGTPLAPFGTLISTIGTTLMTLGSTVNWVSDSFMIGMGKVVAAEGMAATTTKMLAGGFKQLWVDMGPIGWIILGVIALVAAYKGLDAIIESNAEKLEKASDAAAKASEAYDSAKQETSELNDAISKIQETDSAFDNLVAGTAEFNDQLVTANEQIMALIDKYPMLMDANKNYVTTDANGLMHISEAGFKAVKEYQKQIQANASAMNLIQTADLNALENQQKADALRKKINGSRRGEMTEAEAQEHAKNLREADMLEQRAEAEVQLARSNAIRTALADKEIRDVDSLTSVYTNLYDTKRKAAEVEVNKMGSHDIRQQYADYHGYNYDRSTKKITDIEGNEVDYDDKVIKDEVIEQTVLLDFEANASTLNAVLSDVDEKFANTLESTSESSRHFISDVLANNIETDEDLLEKALSGTDFQDIVNSMTEKEMAAILGINAESIDKSNIDAKRDEIVDLLTANATNIAEAQSESYTNLATMLSQSKGWDVATAEIQASQDTIATEIRNLTAEQAHMMSNIGTQLQEGAGMETMKNYISHMSELYKKINEEGLETDKQAAKEIEDIFNSVDITSAAGRLEAYTKLAQSANEDTRRWGESMRSSVEEANLLGKAFDEFAGGDWLELAEHADDFKNSLGQIDAAGIMKASEESHTLKTLLDSGEVSASGMAMALQGIEDGKYSIGAVNDSVLKLLSSFNRLEDEVSKAHNLIENFDAGIDYGEASDFAQENAKKAQEYWDNGEFGNQQLQNYIKLAAGQERWNKAIQEHHGDKYVTTFKDGFQPVIDQLVNGKGIDGDSLNKNIEQAVKAGTLDKTLAEKFKQVVPRIEGDDFIFGTEGSKATNLTTEELKTYLEQVYGVSTEYAQLILEEWTNLSPNLAAELSKNDLMEAISTNEFKASHGTTESGQTILTDQEIKILEDAGGNEALEKVAEELGYVATEQKSAADVMKEASFKVLDDEGNRIDNTNDPALLQNYIKTFNKAEKGSIESLLKTGTQDLFTSGKLDLSKLIQDTQAHGFDQAQAMQAAWQAYQRNEQLYNKGETDKSVSYEGADLEHGIETYEAFTASIENALEASKWQSIGESIAQGIINFINSQDPGKQETDRTYNESQQQTKNKEDADASRDATLKAYDDVNKFFGKIGEWLTTPIDVDAAQRQKTYGGTETTSNADKTEGGEKLNEAGNTLTTAASQFATGVESLTTAGTNLNTAASNLTTAAAVIANNSGNNNPTNGSSTVPGIPQTAQPNQSSVSGAIVIDNSDALNSLDQVYQKATETAEKINEGAIFKVDVDDKGLAAAGKNAESVKNAASGTNTINVSAGEVNLDSIQTAKDKIKNDEAKLPVKTKDDTDAGLKAIKNKIKDTSASVTIKATAATSNITVTVKGNAKGQYNHGIVAAPVFGSAARGRYGQVGPKGKGGLTLTGELGYEVAWLPNENRSMILGANGPQMIDLPGNAVVWNHEQSEEILKQKAIPAGSHFRIPKQSTSSTSGKSGKGKKNNKKNKNKKSKDKSEKEAQKLFEAVNVWWDNFARRTEAHQRIMDKASKAFEKSLKGLTGTAKNAKTALATYQNTLINSAKENSVGLQHAKEQLYNLDNGIGNDALALISYSATTTTTKKDKKGKKKTTTSTSSQQEFVNLGGYIDYNAALDTYEINQAALDTIANLEQRKAIADAANQKLNDLLSKRNKAEEEIQKARDELDKTADTMYETFYSWEKSINEIYMLSKRLEVLSGFKDFKSDLIDFETAMIRAGKQTAEAGKDNILKYLTQQRTDVEQQIKAANALITAREKDFQDALNADVYFAKLQKSIDTGLVSEEAIADYQAAVKALEIYKNANGDTAAITQALMKFNDEESNKEFYDKVQKILDDIFQKENDVIDASSQAVKLSSELVSIVEEANDFIIDFQNDMLDGLKEQAEEQIDQLEGLNDTLTKALKNLLDEVKRKLDERRRIEDNTKTESEISQKQQRLSALRADTAGGHQVEIAQLEKEIAEAQQNYQRSLEDQLLERLQEQADKAEQQRQQQIDLLQAATDVAAENGVTMKQIEEWLSKDDEASKNALKEAYRTAQGYYNKDTSQKEKQRIDSTFEESYAKYKAYIKDTPEWEKIIAASAKGKAETTTNNLSNTSVTTSHAGADKAIADAEKKKADALKATAAPAQPAPPSPTEIYNSTFIRAQTAGLGIDELNKLLTYGPQIGISQDQTLKQLANIFGWNHVVNMVATLFGKKKGAEHLKSLWGSKPSSAQKGGWKFVYGKTYPKYAKGGLANYTGPAWLDGTPSKPELVLDAKDTQNFLALKDVLSKVMGSTQSINNSYGGDNIFEININVDRIEKDYDVDRVADRVKKKILESSSYRNVTQVRNFR